MMWAMLQGTSQRNRRWCDPAKLNTSAAMAALIPHHPLSNPSAAQERRGCQAGRGLRRSALERPQSQRAPSGTRPPSQASPTKSQSKPPGSGTEMAFMPALLCSWKGQARALRNLSAICLCNAKFVFRDASRCSSPTHFTRQCSRTVSEPGPATDVARHRSLSIPSSLAGGDSPLYLLTTPGRGLGFWSQTLSWACADSKHWTSVTTAFLSPESLCPPLEAANLAGREPAHPEGCGKGKPVTFPISHNTNVGLTPPQAL